MKSLLKILLPPRALLLSGSLLLVVFQFALLRLLFLWRNDLAATDLPASLLAQSWLVGLRFDLAISAYFSLALLVLLWLPTRLKPRLAYWTTLPFALLTLLIGLSDVEFFRELDMHLNHLAVEYLSHPKIVAGMIWEGYPIISYLLLGSLWICCCRLWLKGFGRLAASYQRSLGSERPWQRLASGLLLILLLIFASRGGFQKSPLRWGDAYFSDQPFANQLALNGTFTLGRSLLEQRKHGNRHWVKAMPPQQAQDRVRQMLLLEHEKNLASADYPLLRSEPEAAGSTPLQPRNVVVIMMESFSARYVGALGGPHNLTPEFDALARDGVLFSRALSNGTHTHQGVFATLASFPNLPGYEYLMKTMEANQEFSGLPTLLTGAGYQSIFLYNGLLSWDNKEGFLRQHGIDRFVGSGDYPNPTFRDPVWGVSDHDVFLRAIQEFNQLSVDGPFFGAILTLSNHSPFNLPQPLPFARIISGDTMEPRYNGIRYADWALGDFFRQARQQPWFEETLFVMVGDHGFGTPPAITDIRLDRFHVPLLFYAPDLIRQPEIRPIVASQVDITPSVLGLIGLSVPHQSWGRNLFALSEGDPGFAIVKPSGGKEDVAIVRGDRALIRPAEGDPAYYRVDFGFPPQTEPLTMDPAAEELQQQLGAYIQTGLLNLRGRKLGTPGHTASAAGPAGGN